MSPPLRVTTLIPLLLVGFAMTACDRYRVIEHESANQSARVDYVVIHFTSENFADSLRLLTQPSDYPVSSHYLIPETGDSSYPHSRLYVHRLVPEHGRAWHAGRSAWGDETSLNDRSIGIELVNLSGCARVLSELLTPEELESACEFSAFDEPQLALLLRLLQDILERYPDIDPRDIVAHSDIAPDRKVDPGPTFPWRRLYEQGIGAWYDDEVAARYRQRFQTKPPAVATVRRALGFYGYAVEPCGGIDDELRAVLRAFQLHFVPEAITLQPDVETAARLFALLEKYDAEALRALDGVGDCPDGGSAQGL